MRQVITALTAMTWLVLFGSGPIEAQVPKAVSVGFANRTEMDVVVQGYSLVNNVKRAGPTIKLDKNGGKNFETNVPPGNYRYYTVWDANFKVLLRNYQVLIPNRNALFEIRTSATDPKVIEIVQVQ